MRARGQTKAFNRALVTNAREELKRCADARPRRIEQVIEVELFVETTGNGYNVVGASVVRDAGLDNYTSRCLELAFEQRLEIADAGTAAGTLHRFIYPLQFFGDEDQGDAG